MPFTYPRRLMVTTGIFLTLLLTSARWPIHAQSPPGDVAADAGEE